MPAKSEPAYLQFLAPSVQRSLAYEAPGAWMPSLPAGCLALHKGYPAASLIPTADFIQTLQSSVEKEADVPFHYVGSSLARSITQVVADRMAQRGMPLAAAELVMCAGSYRGLDMIASVLLREGDIVAVETPTYMEALEILRNWTPSILGYPVDAEGLVTATVEADLAARKAAGQPLPKLFYVIPSFQNPSGGCLSAERRAHLLALAEAYDFLIIEDDAYGELYFTSAAPVPLRAMPGGRERVIYLGSMSKILAPGFRIGWIGAPAPIALAIDVWKKEIDSSPLHAMAATFWQTHDPERHLQHLRNE
ncbi:MAG TPA: PLP-dependent aminotransferase family protein, partial [Symbiobacteriaceae bacterium]|nr:PLP-dependent aminotransferase family protein [Symbiobacteriaceae bacterium]